MVLKSSCSLHPECFLRNQISRPQTRLDESKYNSGSDTGNPPFHSLISWFWVSYPVPLFRHVLAWMDHPSSSTVPHFPLIRQHSVTWLLQPLPLTIGDVRLLGPPNCKNYLVSVLLKFPVAFGTVIPFFKFSPPLVFLTGHYCYSCSNSMTNTFLFCFVFLFPVFFHPW